MARKSKKVKAPGGGEIIMVDTGRTMRLDELVEYEGNAKIHTPEQIDQIAVSIREFGFNDPIAIDGDNIIIEGHGRLYAARKLGMDTVPVIDLSHLTPEQRRAYIIAHNKLTMNTGFDPDRLASELAQICIEMPDLDMESLGMLDHADAQSPDQRSTIDLGTGEIEEKETMEKTTCFYPKSKAFQVKKELREMMGRFGGTIS